MIATIRLGVLHIQELQFESAIEVLARSLQIHIEFLGEDNPVVAQTHSSLGVAYLLGVHRTGFPVPFQKDIEYSASEMHLETSLRILERAFGVDHPEVRSAKLNLYYNFNIIRVRKFFYL